MELHPILTRYLPTWQQTSTLTPEQHHAVRAIQQCRTAHCGQMRLYCQGCAHHQGAFHSCGHRSCPRCQHHDTARWLQRQQHKLLPVKYFMVTFTLPAQLRQLAKQHPKDVYAALFACAVSTLQDFGRNSKQLSGELGMTAVLHTHTRRLDYHPHVHVVVPGGGINQARRQWKTLRGNTKYLFHHQSLAKVFRARLLQALQQQGLALPATIPQEWVVDCKAVGSGLPALTYLARYLYRGVIAESSILGDDGTHVTFRYKDSKTDKIETRTLKGEEFVGLLLQHVLPKGFRRARDFGFLHGNAKKLLWLVQQVLGVRIQYEPLAPRPRPAFRCSRCQLSMRIVGFIPKPRQSG
jgi:hypothetical protein